MTIRQRAHAFTLWFFALSTPLSLATWVLFLNHDPVLLLPRWLEVLVGYLTLAWFISLVYVLVAFFVRRSFRLAVLCKLSGLTERDERDSFIVNQAARKTFLFTLAMILTALFLSVINFDLKTKTADSPGAFSIGIGADLSLENYVNIVETDEGATKYNFALLPNSFAPLIIIFGVAQVVVFRKHSREVRLKD